MYVLYICCNLYIMVAMLSRPERSSSSRQRPADPGAGADADGETVVPLYQRVCWRDGRRYLAGA